MTTNSNPISGTKYYIFRVNADENVNVDSQMGQSILGDGTTPENIQTTGGMANFQFDPNMTTEVFAHIMNSQRAIETIRAARSITREFIISRFTRSDCMCAVSSSLINHALNCNKIKNKI